MRKIFAILLSAALLGCNEMADSETANVQAALDRLDSLAISAAAEAEEPHYGFFEDDTKLYMCLDKECNEKKLILYQVMN